MMLGGLSHSESLVSENFIGLKYRQTSLVGLDPG